MTVKGVTIGDYFEKANHQLCVVVDIEKCVSMVDGSIKGYKCIAKDALGLSNNEFEVAFATVVRRRKVYNTNK